MQIHISLTESEAEHLNRLAGAWRVSPEEVARTAIRSQFSAFRDLPFQPQLTPSVASELLLHAILNEEGTYTLLRNGVDPGTERMKQLSNALGVLWFHYRNEDTIPISISHAAASIIYYQIDARENTKHLREQLWLELIDISVYAYAVLSGAIADSFELPVT